MMVQVLGQAYAIGALNFSDGLQTIMPTAAFAATA